MHRLRLFTGLSLLLASTALPASAQDIHLNLGSLANAQTLNEQQKWGAFLACAHAAGVPEHLRNKNWVGFTAYTTVLAYNKDVYGKNPPKNWADFFDFEKFPGTRGVGATYPASNM